MLADAFGANDTVCHVLSRQIASLRDDHLLPKFWLRPRKRAALLIFAILSSSAQICIAVQAQVRLFRLNFPGASSWAGGSNGTVKFSGVDSDDFGARKRPLLNSEQASGPRVREFKAPMQRTALSAFRLVPWLSPMKIRPSSRIVWH